MRKVTEFENNNKRAIVYKDSEAGEYVVKFYTILSNGMQQYLKGGDYHTDDKADAVATALYETSKV